MDAFVSSFTHRTAQILFSDKQFPKLVCVQQLIFKAVSADTIGKFLKVSCYEIFFLWGNRDSEEIVFLLQAAFTTV